MIYIILTTIAIIILATYKIATGFSFLMKQKISIPKYYSGRTKYRNVMKFPEIIAPNLKQYIELRPDDSPYVIYYTYGLQTVESKRSLNPYLLRIIGEVTKEETENYEKRVTWSQQDEILNLVKPFIEKHKEEDPYSPFDIQTLRLRFLAPPSEIPVCGE